MANIDMNSQITSIITRGKYIDIGILETEDIAKLRENKKANEIRDFTKEHLKKLNNVETVDELTENELNEIASLLIRSITNEEDT